MKRTALMLIMSLLVGLVLGAVPGQKSAAQQQAPYWAYGFLKPAVPGEAAPPCRDATPVSCNRPVPPVTDDGVLRRVPGSSASFTLRQIGFGYGPADWFPEDHPPMPEIVARGREKDGVRACALCHYHNGKGKMENAGVAGLPVNYFMQAMAAFASGARKSADPRKHNTHEMIAIAKTLTSAEMSEVVEGHRSFSAEERFAAVTRIGLSGDAEAVARELGVPVRDLLRWQKDVERATRPSYGIAETHLRIVRLRRRETRNSGSSGGRDWV